MPTAAMPGRFGSLAVSLRALGLDPRKLLAIGAELGIPVKPIGMGEKLEDLRPFEAGEFARALIS